MNNPDTSERRRFHRVIFDAPAQIETANEVHHTTLLDISLKGALATTPQAWRPEVGEPVVLKVMLDDGERVIAMKATCAHIEGDRIGMLCEEIDMESISLLRRLVELNISDEALLQRDLEALG